MRNLVEKAILAVMERSRIIARLVLRLQLIELEMIRRDVLLKYMCSQGASGSVIYDIGACTGLYSVILARKVANSRVYAFEPNTTSFERLVKNIRLMNLQERIIPLQIALDESPGTRTFYVSSEKARSSLHEYNAGHNSSIVESHTVDCHSIDDLVESGLCKSPDMIKIDAEGHEYPIIRGAKNLIMSKSPVIGFEPHEVDNDGSSDIDKIKTFLAQFEYECKSIGYPIWCSKKVKQP